MGDEMSDKVHAKFSVGEIITWQSSAAGAWKRKTGEIVAIVGPGKSSRRALEILARHVITASTIKASDRSANERYIVKVQPPTPPGPARTRARTPVYYAPLVKVIDGSSAAAGQRVKAGG
jgi:hypothetical protein